MSFFRRAQHPADETLSAGIDGRLDASARARLDAHLGGCARCRGALDDLRTVRSALAGLPQADLPRSFILREADVRPQPAPRSVPAFWAAPVLSGVAMVALVVFLTLVSIDAFGRPTTGGDSYTASVDTGATAAEAAPQRSAAGDGAYDSANPPTGALAPEADSGQNFDDTERCGQTAACVPGNGTLSLFGPPSPLLYGPPAPGQALSRAPAAPTAVSLPATSGESASDGDSDTALRIAEIATAAVAIVSAGGLAVVWRRRQSVL